MRNSFFQCALLCVCHGGVAAHGADHDALEAYLQAPFYADNRGGRTVTLHLAAAAPGRRVAWQLDLLGHDCSVLRHWHGVHRFAGAALSATVRVRWRATPPGKGAGISSRGATGRARPASGIYPLRLRARLLGAGTPEAVEQRWDVAVGVLAGAAARVPAGAGTLPPAPAWPYSIYLGNLHSQTRHSDGGAALDQCTGAQAPGTAPHGPSDAYAYGWRHGLDFLMTSEHNHMFDGDAGTAGDADAGAVRALYQRGLQEAAAWNGSGKSLLALYGQEWGVIDHGGHLNIFNAPWLLGWERNHAGALLADVETPRHDYAGLYALLRKHGWYGQFNHPRADQFVVDGQPLGWSADGDASMLLCEVMNSHAYSTRTDETEARHSSYEAACNRLLEAGYHVAFSSNQDNHCANWGASYGNRTGVLLPRGQRLDAGTLLAALQARRVFATMDKHSAIVLTAGRRQPADSAQEPGAPAPPPTPGFDATEHLMGERFAHGGELVLRVRHFSASGRRVAAVRLFHGVPGRRGTVSAVSDSDYTVITPPPGAHFYYARITQDDGTQLWSAPVWVDQRE